MDGSLLSLSLKYHPVKATTPYPIRTQQSASASIPRAKRLAWKSWEDAFGIHPPPSDQVLKNADNEELRTAQCWDWTLS